MSTNVKMVGYYQKVNSIEEAKKLYRDLGHKVTDSCEEEFVEDNYEDLFDCDYEECIGKWTPFFDYNNTLGVIYLMEYERDAFDLYTVFSEPAPILFGKEGVPFAVLYYNGAENPLKFK